MDPISAARLSARLSNAFVLDLVKLGGHRRAILDILVRTAMLHAGVAHIIADPKLQMSFAGLDEDVPDDLRRPASVNSVAASLRIPYETARRRVAVMCEQGVCRPVGKGFIVPSAVTNSPPFRAACAIQYEKLGELYRRLRDFGVVEAPLPSPSRWPVPPHRLAGRLTVEYVLRFRELVSEHIRDVVTSAVLMELVCANTEHLDSGGGTGGIGPGGFVPDHLRHPVTPAEMAQRLGIPHETLRRHLGQLATRGFCKRVDEGYIVPATVLAREGFVRLVVDNQRHLVRLFARLAPFGVLQEWEEARVAAAA